MFPRNTNCKAQSIPFTYAYLEWLLNIAGDVCLIAYNKNCALAGKQQCMFLTSKGTVVPFFPNAYNKFSVLLQRTNEIRAKRTQLEKEKSKLLRERKDLRDILRNHCCKFTPPASNFQPGLDAPSSNNKDSKFITLLSQMQMFENLQH